MSLPNVYRKIVTHTKTNVFADATKILDVPMPTPGLGEVLVRVRYAGIECSDAQQTAGVYGPLKDAEPLTNWDGSVQVGDVGVEMCGKIVALGEGADAANPAALAVGTPVVVAGYGVGYREYVCIDAATVVPVPEVAPEPVALVCSGATAVGGLEIAGHLQSGEQVLVTGAAGGTGQFAVQWAKQMGCYVVGVCGSEEKQALVSELGADGTINYKLEQDLTAAIGAAFPAGIDVCYEGVGGPLRDAAWTNMADFGRLVVIGSASSYEREGGMFEHKIASCSGLFKSAVLSSFFQGSLFAPDQQARAADILTRLMAAWGKGKIQIKLDPACANFQTGLEGVYEAQDYMRTGQNVGKVWVKIAD